MRKKTIINGGINGNVNDAVIPVIQKEISILNEKFESKEQRDYELFKELTNTHKNLQERVIILETNLENISNTLISLKKDNSMQTKLIVGLVITIVGAIVGQFIKNFLS